MALMTQFPLIAYSFISPRMGIDFTDNACYTCVCHPDGSESEATRKICVICFICWQETSVFILWYLWLVLLYKITKKLRDYQRIIGLFSVFSKIICRAYRISHLRNVALLQGGTFAVEKASPLPLPRRGDADTAECITYQERDEARPVRTPEIIN